MNENNCFPVFNSGEVPISKILNDCVSGLCVTTYMNEPLSSILRKICDKITTNEGSDSSSCCYTFEDSDTVTFSVVGNVVSANTILSNVGTVTNFSAGDLAPLFTTDESAATTTPHLTFSLNTQAANTIFMGPATGADDFPSFRALVLDDIPDLSGLYGPPTADNGLSIGSPIRLGQAVGAVGDPAKLTMNREIPLGNFKLIFNNKTGSAGSYSELNIRANNGVLPQPGIGMVTDNYCSIDYLMTVPATTSVKNFGNQNWYGTVTTPMDRYLGTSGYHYQDFGGNSGMHYFIFDMSGSSTNYVSIESNGSTAGNSHMNWVADGSTQIGLAGNQKTVFGRALSPSGIFGFVHIHSNTATTVSLHLEPSSLTSSPLVDGNVWIDSNTWHMYARLNGVTKQLDNDNAFTADTFIQNQFAIAQTTSNFWIDGHGRINDYLQIGSNGRVVNDYTNTMAISKGNDSTLGGDLRVGKLVFWDQNIPNAAATASIYSQQSDFLNFHAQLQIVFDAPFVQFTQPTTFELGASHPLIIRGSSNAPTIRDFTILYNANVAGANEDSKYSYLAFAANRTTGAYTRLGRVGTYMIDTTNAAYKGDLLFETVSASVNSGNPTEYMRLKYDGRLYVKSLDTDGTAPTTSGNTRVVICDGDGLLSFANIPGVGVNPTFQDTLISGSTLTQDNTIDAGSHNLTVSNIAALDIRTIGGPSNTVYVGGAFGGYSYADFGSSLSASSALIGGSSQFTANNNSLVIAPANTSTPVNILNLANTPTQDRLIGQVSGTNRIGYITFGTGLSLVAGVLSATPPGSQTFQSTLTAGSTLTGNNTVNVNSHNFVWDNAIDYTIKATGDTFLKIAAFGSATNGDILTLIDNTTGKVGWGAPGAGSSGTVTTFSAGDLAPLFTTSEANVTTTPVLSFTLSNAAANTYFGNVTGASTAPAHTAAGALTRINDTNVTLTLGGNPAVSLLAATSLTLGWTGILAIARGGTGLGVLGTANQLLRVNTGATALEYFTPTFVTSAVVTLNTLTAATQNFAIGATGTDFNIQSITDTHTFNIPSASLTARGLVTTVAQSFEGIKTFNVGVVINESGAASDFRVESDTNANALYVDATNNRVGILTAAPGFPLDITGNTRIQSGGLGIGTSPAAASALAIGGTGWTSAGIVLFPTISATAGTSPSIVGITGTIIEGSSLTHPVISSLNVSAPTITAGLATVADAATVFINGAPSTTVTGGLYSLLVGSGTSRFNGDIVLGTGTAYSTGGYDNVVRNQTSGRFEVVDPDVIGLNAQTGTTYTPIISDKGKMIRMSNAASNTLTVPTNASVAFAIGTQIEVLQESTGQTNIAAAVGVTLLSADGALKARVRYSVISLLKIATNTWLVAGDITV